MTSTIGQRIKEVRSKRNLSQAELGFRLGIAPSTVSNWEADTRVPSVADLLETCNVLSESVGDFRYYIFFGDEADQSALNAVYGTRYVLKEDVISKLSEFIKDMIQMNEIRIGRKGGVSALIESMVKVVFNSNEKVG